MREAFQQEREAAAAKTKERREKKAAEKAEAKPADSPEEVAPPTPTREELQKRFDADGDGELNETEKDAMREAFRQEREAKAAAKKDTKNKVEPAVGEDSPAEVKRESAPVPGPEAERTRRMALLTRFDADGDGQLNDEERVAYREEARGQSASTPVEEATPGVQRAGSPPDAPEAEAPAPPTPEEQRAHFDADGDGELSDSEKTAMREAFRQEREATAARNAEEAEKRKARRATPPREEPVPPPTPEEQLARFDADGDGQLNEQERAHLREEFKKSRGAARKRPAPRDSKPGVSDLSREDQLARFDRDGDGKLNEEERTAYRKARLDGARGGAAPPDPIAELPAAYRRFDRDRDGTLSPAESRLARQELIRKGKYDGEAETTSSTLPEAARQFDLDGNGEIDEKERTAAKRYLRERRDEGLDFGEEKPELDPAIGAEVAQSRIAVARAAVAEEMTRRREVQAFREKRKEDSSQRTDRDYKTASLKAYAMLSKRGKKSYRPGRGRGGFKPEPRQGVQRGKKRGSKYYRTKMRGGGRGGQRGNAGGRGGQNFR